MFVQLTDEHLQILWSHGLLQYVLDKKQQHDASTFANMFNLVICMKIYNCQKQLSALGFGFK